jgi:hypothetical protein
VTPAPGATLLPPAPPAPPATAAPTPAGRTPPARDARRSANSLGARALAPAAALVALAGYADLWRGGTSAAAVLLVVAYCVLAPVAVFGPGRLTVAGGGPAPGPAPGAGPSYGLAASVAAGVFALYAATLAPTTAMWDASEYIAAARVLGLPHPPGNPLFVLLAHVAGLVPVPVSYAERINLLAAATSALSAGLWCLCAERVLVPVVPPRGARRAAAAAAALLGATAFTVWNQSVVNEKVYTVSGLFLAAVSWAVLRWIDAAAALPNGTRRAPGDRLLVGAAYLSGLGYAVHPAGLLAAPAAAAAVLARRPATAVRGRLLLALAAAFLAGASVFAVVPVRAAHRPAIDEAYATACEGGRPELACTASAETARRVAAYLSRAQYGGHAVLDRQAPLPAQLAQAWEYFRWQWLRDPDGRRPGLQLTLALVFAGLGVLGGLAHWRHDRPTFWYFGPLVATLTGGLVFYLNFKYGYAQAPELGGAVPREVRDRDYFYFWTFAGVGRVGRRGARRGVAVGGRRAGGSGGASSLGGAASRGGGAPPPGARAWLATAPVLALAVVPLAANARAASRAGQTFTREWARDLLASVEPYAVLVTNGDNDSFPLWYAQQVEGVRRDVTVALVPYLQTDDYVRRLALTPPAPYDEAAGPAAYRGRAGRRPAGPLVRLTRDELAALPGYAVLDRPQRFRHAGIDAEVPAGVLTRDQLVVLHVIRDSFPERPVYFSTGGYANALGLGPYLRTQGLAQRLDSAPALASADLVALPEAGRSTCRGRGRCGTRCTGRRGRWCGRGAGPTARRSGSRSRTP